MSSTGHTVHEVVRLHGRAPVFRDRRAGGVQLADMLQGYHGSDALVVAIPAGGVPVAIEVASRLALPLEVAPVSKVLLPWTTEAGFGAVAFDGTVWLDDEAVQRFSLSERQVADAVAQARAKVERRLVALHGARPPATFTGRPVMLLDDGIAAGSTMRTAIAAARRQAAVRVVVAVPTGHQSAIEAIAALADDVYCANIREGGRFAVADAYDEWSDVEDDEVMQALAPLMAPRP